MLALGWLGSCRAITVDTGRVVVLEVSGTSPRVEEGDTLRLMARPLNAAGEVVPGVSVTWAILDTGAIGFDLTPAGLITASVPGSARVQARVETLRTDPLTVTVTPRPDTAAATGPLNLVVGPAEDQSAPLAVTVYDQAAGGPLTPLAGKRVAFQVSEPPAGGGFFLSATGPTPGLDPRRAETVTGSTGEATVRAYRESATAAPDSIVVEATALTARGDTVAGTPARFVVTFQ